MSHSTVLLGSLLTTQQHLPDILLKAFETKLDDKIRESNGGASIFFPIH
jgi:hypothetical protein